MEQESIGTIMRREAARATPWGIMLLVVVYATGSMIKQDVKEAVEFSFSTAVKEARQAVLAPEVFTAVKQNTKEAIQYATRSAADEYIRAQQHLKRQQR